MNTQEQAYINGFVKRAMEYGFSEREAVEILKQSALVGDQHKLDVDKDGKIEASDLKTLRARKSVAKVAAMFNALPGAKGPGKMPAPGTPGYE